MSERVSYNPGEFSWVDLGTTDLEAGVRFYSELMGWEPQSAGPVEETGGYGFFMYKGKMVGGYGPTFDGQPSSWNSYVTVSDADVTAARIGEAGGTVVAPPMDLPQEAGRMAVATDPGGAFFSIVQQGPNSIGAQLVNEVGTWTWNHLNTRNLEEAKRFYGEIFGWEAKVADGAPPDSPYLMWQVEGQKWAEGIAGVSQMGETDFPPEVPSHWLVYLAVADAGAAAEKTQAEGGSVVLPPLRIPVGTLAVLVDPQGAMFGILEPDYPEDR